MQLEIVKATITAATKGANIHLEWHRNCKTKKSCTDTISKSVQAVGRVGIDYDKQKAVVAKRAEGELPSENNGLPWGQWAIFPYLIEHKGRYYVRLYHGTGNAIPKRQFYRNGNPVAFEDVESVLMASEKKSKTGDCFCCKVEDMTAIRWEPTPPTVNRQPVKEATETEVKETENVTA